MRMRRVGSCQKNETAQNAICICRFLRAEFIKIFQVIGEIFLDKCKSELEMSEFGCGTGIFSLYLHRRVKKLRCLDINQKSLNIIKKRTKGFLMDFEVTSEFQSFKCEKCIAIFSIYEAIKSGFDINQLLKKTNDLIICDLNTDNRFLKYFRNYEKISKTFHDALLKNRFSAVKIITLLQHPVSCH